MIYKNNNFFNKRILIIPYNAPNKHGSLSAIPKRSLKNTIVSYQCFLILR